MLRWRLLWVSSRQASSVPKILAANLRESGVPALTVSYL
jgi:hypothetical protein